MRRPSLQTFTLFILLFCAGIFGVYATKSLRSGPKINVITPLAYSTVDVPVRVEGHINKPKSATINGATLLVTKEGYFTADVILLPPIDSIDIWAVNAYGKENLIKIPVAVIE